MASAPTLAATPAKAYIAQNGCRVGLIPGVAIGGRFRANGDGPTNLMVEAVRFELTGPCEGFGRPKVRRGVSSVR